MKVLLVWVKQDLVVVRGRRRREEVRKREV